MGRQSKVKRQSRSEAGDAGRTLRTGRDESLPSASDTADGLTTGRWVLYGAGLLVALLAVYQPLLRGAFLWDDNIYVYQNATVMAPDGLHRIWFDPMKASPSPYPLIFTVYWVLYRLFELNTLGYHVVNVLLHWGAAFMLAVNLRRLGAPAALFAAAAFAFHPMEVDSVGMINELKDVISGLCYMLAMWQWIKFLDTDRPKAAGLSFLFFLLAMLGKTVTCTFPVIALVIALWRRPGPWRRWFLCSIPFFALAVVLGLVTAMWEKGMGAQGTHFDFSLFDRLRIACRAPWFYAGKLLWPAPQVFTYPRWSLLATDPKGWLYLAAAPALVAALWAARRRVPPAAFLPVVYFVVSLGPALGFLNFTSMEYTFATDHYQYLSGIGIIVLAAMLGCSALRRLGAGPGVMRAAAMILCSGLALTSRQRATIYVDGETIFRDNLRKHPGSWISAYNIGVETSNRGDLDGAVPYYEKAVELLPGYGDAWNNLGYYYQTRKEHEKAVFHYAKAANFTPHKPEPFGNWGISLLDLGRVDEAVEKFEHAAKIRPELRAGYCLLINDRAVDLMLEGNFDLAIRMLEGAVKYLPTDEQANINLRSARIRRANALKSGATPAATPTPEPVPAP